MSQAKLSRWLKAIMVGAEIGIAIVYFLIIPVIGKDIVAANPEFAYCYWPWLIFLWTTSVPLYVAAVFGWKIAREIGLDNSFSRENAVSLKRISQLAVADTIYFFIGIVVFSVLNMIHSSIVIAAFFVLCVGIVIIIVSAGLSHLVYKAAKMREENELTI